MKKKEMTYAGGEIKVKTKCKKCGYVKCACPKKK